MVRRDQISEIRSPRSDPRDRRGVHIISARWADDGGHSSIIRYERMLELAIREGIVLEHETLNDHVRHMTSVRARGHRPLRCLPHIYTSQQQ